MCILVLFFMYTESNNVYYVLQIELKIRTFDYKLVFILKLVLYDLN